MVVETHELVTRPTEEKRNYLATFFQRCPNNPTFLLNSINLAPAHDSHTTADERALLAVCTV